MRSFHHAMIGTAAVAAVVLAGLPLGAHAESAGPSAEQLRVVAEAATADAAPFTGTVRWPSVGLQAQMLVPDDDYWVFDVNVDALGDSAAVPELEAAALSVGKEDPDLMFVLGVTASPTVQSGTFAVVLDIDGDLVPDYGTGLGDSLLDEVYEVPLYSVGGAAPADTGLRVAAIRMGDAYGIAIPDWRGKGFGSVSYLVGIDDGVNQDYAPDTPQAPVPVGALVPVTATPSPSPDPTPEVTRPGKVRKITVRAAKSSAVLRWKSVTGAVRYEVRVKKSRSHSSWRVTKKSAVRVKGLKAGKRYTAKVRAVNEAGKGPVAAKGFRTKR